MGRAFETLIYLGKTFVYKNNAGMDRLTATYHWSGPMLKLETNMIAVPIFHKINGEMLALTFPKRGFQTPSRLKVLRLEKPELATPDKPFIGELDMSQFRIQDDLYPSISAIAQIISSNEIRTNLDI